MKKALRIRAGLSLVDKRFEPLARRSQISNLNLVKAIAEVVEYLNPKE